MIPLNFHVNAIHNQAFFARTKMKLIKFREWLVQPQIWRYVAFVSSVVGLSCFALSSSFNSLFGKWKLWNILTYSVISLVISLTILFAKVPQRSKNLWLKALLAFLVLTMTSVYSYYLDKERKGKAFDIYSMISNAAFAIMSLSWSRQTFYGIEVDFLYFFCTNLIIQLMTIHKWLVFVGVTFSFCLLLLRPLLDTHQQNDHSQLLNFMDCIEELQNENANLISTVSRHVIEYLESNVQSDVNMVRDTLPPNSLNNLKETVNFLLGHRNNRYEKRCCNVYSSWRREFLEGCFSTCNLQEIKGESNWIQACTVAVKILFPMEKRLCDHVFEKFPSAADISFTDTCKDLILRVLSSTHKFASGSNVQNFVDCIQTLNELFPSNQLLLPDPFSISLRNEVRAVGNRLREAVRSNLMELEKLICFDMVKVEVPGGGIHPIHREVMKHLSVFNKSLLFPIFDSTIQLLVRKLDDKSKSYGDPALGYVFLVNNLRYIAYKVKQCELGSLLGEDWFRKIEAKAKHNLHLYQRSFLNNDHNQLFLVIDEMDL